MTDRLADADRTTLQWAAIFFFALPILYCMSWFAASHACAEEWISIETHNTLSETVFLPIESMLYSELPEAE